MYKNNFDFLRIVFASTVIISHSYPLAGDKECDLLCMITGNDQLQLSYIGFRGFFIISGFLIFRSLEHCTDLTNYFWKRILRLFPALFAMLLLTVLLGPFVYENLNVPYLANKDVWSYIPNNLSLFNLQYRISGIFETNPYKGAINGSLWTIPYEFTLYLLLAAFFFIHKNTSLVRIILGSITSILIVVNLFFPAIPAEVNSLLIGKYLFELAAFFFGGALLASLRIEQNKYQNALLLISAGMVGLSLAFDYFMYIKYIFLTLAVICFGLKSTRYLSDIRHSFGDLSYGIYIYSFPIQQTLVYYFKLGHGWLMFYSFILSYIFGYISWHFIEKKAFKLKDVAFIPQSPEITSASS